MKLTKMENCNTRSYCCTPENRMSNSLGKSKMQSSSYKAAVLELRAELKTAATALPS
jgi:hypothetical protein